ncbi:MAG: hypothetical protein AAF288_09635 [Planctomycetota bacterium]
MTDTAQRPTPPAPASRRAGGSDRSELLQAVARRSLSPEQQAEALRAAQARAEQRVKLGMQLFKAAESKLGQQTDLLASIKADQQKLRDDVQDDVARTLQTYDQWMGRIDESFTTAVSDLQQRLDSVEQDLDSKLEQMRGLADRAETVLRLVSADLDPETEAEPEPQRDPVTGRVEGEPIRMPHWPSMQAQSPQARQAPARPDTEPLPLAMPEALPVADFAPAGEPEPDTTNTDVFRRVLGRLKQDEDPGPAAA